MPVRIADGTNFSLFSTRYIRREGLRMHYEFDHAFILNSNCELNLSLDICCVVNCVLGIRFISFLVEF